MKRGHGMWRGAVAVLLLGLSACGSGTEQANRTGDIVPRASADLPIAPRVSLASSSRRIVEGESAEITVRLSGPSAVPLEIPFTLGGTATPGIDYTTEPAAAVSFQPGETQKLIRIRSVADGLREARIENIKLRLAALPSLRTSRAQSVGIRIRDQREGDVASVVRVEIDHSGLLFTQLGQTRQLRARAYDAADNEVSATVRWSSSTDSVIGVDANGMATAVAGNGSALITAEVLGRSSAPLLALVSPLAPSVIPVDDADVIRGPQDSDPNAEPDVANTYTVIIGGERVPALGDRLVSTGSQPIAGEVVEVLPVAGGWQLTLRYVPIPELLPSLSIQQTLDLEEAPVVYEEGIEAFYSISRDGDRFVFTPREPGAAPVAKVGNFSATLAPFNRGCEAELSGGPDGSLPITVSEAPSMDFSLRPSLDIVVHEGQLERFVVHADPQLDIKAALSTSVAFQGKVECKMQLLTIRIPVGGPASFIVGGQVPMGLGAEISGKFPVANFRKGYQHTTTAALDAGLDCANDCSVVAEVSRLESKGAPIVQAEAELDDRVEASFTGFLFAEIAIGNPFLQSLRFSALTAKLGGKLGGSFASKQTQITDAAYKSSYAISTACELGPSLQLSKLAAYLFNSVAVIPKKLECPGIPLSNMPTASRLFADRATWAAGDAVTVTADFAAETLDFLPLIGPYNIDTVHLVRRDNAGIPRILQSVSGNANTRKSSFEFQFTGSDDTGLFRPGDANELFVFIVSRLLPVSLLPLEVGNVAGNQIPVVQADAATVQANSSGTLIDVLANDSDADDAVLTVSAVSPAAEGTVTISPDASGVIYVPPANYSGLDSFSYTASDGRGGTATAQVSITIVSTTGGIAFGGGSAATSGGATACADELDASCQLNSVSFSETVFLGSAGGSATTTARAVGVDDGVQEASASGQASITAGPAGSVRSFSASCEAAAEVTEETLQIEKAEATAGSQTTMSFDQPPGTSYTVSLTGVPVSSDPTYNFAAKVQVSFNSDADGYYREQSAAGVISDNGSASGTAEGEASFRLLCSAFPVNGLGAGTVRSQASATLTLTAPP